MKIFKSKYGWSASAHSRDKDGNEIKCYEDVNFKKGTEPMLESIEGELIFREKSGKEWTAFLSSYMKQGQALPKIVLMPMGAKPREIPQRVQGRLMGNDDRDIFHRKAQEQPQEVVISDDELPFF